MLPPCPALKEILNDNRTDKACSTAHKNRHYALSLLPLEVPLSSMGLIARRAFASARRGGFALAAAATIVSISARHSFSPVARFSRIAGIREKTHSRKAIRKLGTEYIVDLVDGYRRYPSPLTIAKPPCNPRATAFASAHVAPPPRRCPATAMLWMAAVKGVSQRSQRAISGSNADGMPTLLNNSANRWSPCLVFMLLMMVGLSLPSLSVMAITAGMPKLHRPIASLKRSGSKVRNMNCTHSALLRCRAGSTAST